MPRGRTPDSTHAAATGMVLLAAVCFGTTGTAQALGPDASPATVGAVRLLVGAALLVAAALWRGTPRPGTGRGRDGAAALWRGTPVVRGRHTPLVVMGAAIAAYQLCFFAAVAATGVAVGTVVALGSAPALAGLLARVADGAPLTRRWAAATALACAGVATLVLGAGGVATVDPVGVLLAVGAGASYAGYTVAAKRLLTRGESPESVMARGFGLGALLLLPVLVLGDTGWVASPGGLAMAVFLGAVPTALAYVLFARGLRRLDAGETATLTLAEPLTATALGIVVLDERPEAVAALGAALVLAGLVALALPGGPRGAPQPRGVPAEVPA